MVFQFIFDLLTTLTLCSVIALNSTILYGIYYYIYPLVLNVKRVQQSSGDIVNPLALLKCLNIFPDKSDKSTETDNSTTVRKDGQLLFADSPHVQMDKIGELFRKFPNHEDNNNNHNHNHGSSGTLAAGDNTTDTTSTAANNKTGPCDLLYLLDQANVLVEQVQSLGVNPSMKGAKGQLQNLGRKRKV